MNKLALVAMLGALTCAPALAQEAPQPPAGFPAPPNMQAMTQIHSDERVAMLNALTPEHRQLLATIAGQLAIATTPDYDAAAKQLDNALSPSEKQAITDAQKSARDKMKAAMDKMQTPPGATRMGGNRFYRRAESMTPGSTLLHTAMGEGNQVMFMTTSMEAHP